MKTWLERITPKFLNNDQRKSSIPEGIWHKCPDCKQTVYTKDIVKLLLVCPLCNFHFPLSPSERIKLLLDENSFGELFADLSSGDPIKFVDSKPYPDRLKAAIKKTGAKEAVVTGIGLLSGKKVALAVLDFDFMGGSMGSVVGEKITRLIEHCHKHTIPLVTVSTSGGARMQEGTLSLMQMAKTSIALNLLREAGIPFISVLTNPTMGGVSASFAMLGDVIIAEPGALIGFAGPRVIRQTIKQDLPDGFQLSEFQLSHGGIDSIVTRRDLKEQLGLILSYLHHNK